MGERQLFGMQEKPAEVFDGFFDLDVRNGIVAAFIVSCVADDGMIDRCEMNSDLVRSAGFDLDVEQCEFFETLSNLPQA